MEHLTAALAHSYCTTASTTFFISCFAEALGLIAYSLAADCCTYRDALSGSKTIAHIHTPQQFRAVQLVRSSVVIQTFAVLCLIQLQLARVETKPNTLCNVQMALPAIEEPLGYDRCAGDLASQNNSHGAVTPCDVTVAHSLQLFKGWRPTMLGSSWIELAICAFYLFEIACLYLIRD
eukprot:12047-Heterococcus_DN1.PRE.1